jgi:hypothetical protein
MKTEDEINARIKALQELQDNVYPEKITIRKDGLEMLAYIDFNESVSKDIAYDFAISNLNWVLEHPADVEHD